MRSKARGSARRISRFAALLICLGTLAQLAALLVLRTQTPLVEYAICAPDVQRTEEQDGSVRIESGLDALIKARDTVEEQLGDALAALSVGGLKAGQTVSGNGVSVSASLRAAGERWPETFPRELISGRWMDASELKSGARVAVLDEDLAFALFASESALDKTVKLDDAEYRVIGTARHRRGVGEADAYSVYVPLSAVAAQGVQLDTLTMAALPAAGVEVRQSFSSAMESAWGAGTLHDIQKEAMGELMPSRILAFALGMTLLFRLGRWLRDWAGRSRARSRELRARLYPKDYLPPIAARALGVIVCAALWLLAAWMLLRFLIDPVYTFTEWVPESLVKLTDLKTVFWSLVADAARALRVNTQESARVAFWGGLARAGAFIFLLGWARMRPHEKKMKNSSASGNQSDPKRV